MKTESWIIILGLLGFFITLTNFFFSGSPLQLFISCFALYVLITGIYMKKGSIHTMSYYMGFLGIILIQGIILTYIYTFTPLYALDKSSFYINAGFLIVFIVIFSYMFTHRKKYFKNQDNKS